jgi:hypothetical protein
VGSVDALRAAGYDKSALQPGANQASSPIIWPKDLLKKLKLAAVEGERALDTFGAHYAKIAREFLKAEIPHWGGTRTVNRVKDARAISDAWGLEDIDRLKALE